MRFTRPQQSNATPTKKDSSRLKTLLVFGYGYSSSYIGRALVAKGWRVIGTTRSAEKADIMAAEGVEPIIWPGGDMSAAIAEASHVLMSAGPTADGDPVLNALSAQILPAKDRLDWVGYLSTTGVYGDRGGDWVTENDALTPSTERGKWRVAAEQAWLDTGLPVHIFRLAGIYGPGRGPFAKVRNGTARRIIKEGQVFSRIHVDDIAQTVIASINHPNPGAYNVCDNDPAPPQDVIAEAARLLGLPIPPAIPFEDADMTPMARSFYGESKKVSNARIINELGVKLKYPDYKSGLVALLAQESEKNPTDSD